MAAQRACALLLALAAALGNEAAEARRPLALLLRGLGKSGLAQKEPPPGVPAAGTVKAEFVRKCTVTLSVGDKKLLPVDALDKFCRQTDAYVECKIKLVMGYEAVHESGGNIAGFCGDAYEWFRKKYGMLCPLQCEKLQCRSTCAWLKEHKRLRDHSKDLAADDLEASVLEGELSDAVAACKAAEQEEQSQNRTVSRSEAAVQHCQEESTHHQKHVADAQAEVTKEEERVVSLKESLAGYESQVHVGEGKLTELQHEVDKAQLDLDHLNQQRARLEDKIKEENATLASMSLQTEQFQQLVEAHNKTATALADRVEAANNQAKDQEQVLQNNALDEEQRYAERVKLEKMRSFGRTVSNAANQAKDKVEAADSEFQDAKSQAQNQADKVQNLTEELQQADANSTALEAKLEPLQAAVTAVKENVSGAKEDYQHANTTLAHALKALKEDKALLDRETELQHEAESACAEAKANLTNAEKALKKAGKAVEAAKAEEAGVRERLANISSSVQQRLKEHEEAHHEHRSWAPEIVGQHGLLELLEPLLGL